MSSEALAPPDKERFRAANHARLAADMAERREAFESRPAMVEIASHDHCNLRCVMCPQGYDMPHHRMPPGRLEAICHDLFPFAETVLPSAGGEPLLADMDTILALARRYLVDVHLITNATLLTEERFREMADRLSVIEISIDSPDRDRYERIRLGASFDRVIANVAAAARLEERRGVEMVANFVLMRDNVEDLPRMVFLAADLGLDTLNVMRHVREVAGAERFDPESAYADEEIAAYVEEAVVAARSNGINLHLNLANPRYLLFNGRTFRRQRWQERIGFMHGANHAFCYSAAASVRVTPAGDVFPCCIGPPDLRMGNLFTERFEDVWNCENYRSLRREMFSGRWRRSCSACPIRHIVTQDPERTLRESALPAAPR